MQLPTNVPSVVVNLDRPRRIAFTLGAMRRIKQATGKSVTDEGSELTDVMGAFIWAMLIEEDRKDVTVEQVEDMIWPGNLDEVTAAFNQVVGQSTPEGKVEAVPVETASLQT